MKVESHYCDACGVLLDDHGFGMRGLRDDCQSVGRVGLVVTFGYSPGGWGQRQNLVNWSGEVCDHCYRLLGVVMAKVWGDRLAAIRAGQPAPELPRATARHASWLDRLRSRLTTPWPWRR